MAEMNLPDNRPLARAAVWFLVDAGIVLVVLCGVLLHPELVAEYFDERTLRSAGMVALTVLFSLLAATSSVLGFLANCRPGRATGLAALVFLIAGWTAIGAAYFAT